MLLLALLAAAAVPAPGEVRSFRDWAVGCDNGRACTAIALVPEESADEDWLVMSLGRAAAPGARPRIRFGVQDGDPRPAGLKADGKNLPGRMIQSEAGSELDDRGKAAAFAALRTAKVLEVLDAKGQAIGKVSLAGASAALLYMDDRQKRVGTVTALARPGPRPVGAVPAPPPLPVIRAAAMSRKAPRRMPLALAARFRKEACDDGQPDDGAMPETYRLDAAHSLAYIPAGCLSGAYNHAALLLVAADTGPWRPADYDVGSYEKGEGSPAAMAFNASWEARTGELQIYMKGRGLGDCGTRQAFVWDGARFRLVRQSEMPECRGSTDYIGTWRAEATRR